MKTNRIAPIISAVLVLLAVTLACAGGATAEPTAVPPTATLVPTEKPTEKPTSTPMPTATPNLQATQQSEELDALLKDYEEKGYVSTTEGTFTELDPFKEEWAQIGWFNSWLYSEVDSDFLLKGHFSWSTAAATSDPSGCGVIFGVQENGDYYVFFLDKARIIFYLKRGETLYSVGKTRGSGRANFGNPAEADVIVAVKGQTTFVSVDGEVTEYTLSVDQTTRGAFGFSLLSGTNRDYGTRCEITDILLWMPE